MSKEGKKNDSEKPRMDLISSKAMLELAKVLTFGARKYASHNWRQGLAYSRIIAAIMRHTNAYNDGETNDPETGLSHMAHVLCEAMFLLEFEKTRPDLDDRYRPCAPRHPANIQRALDVLGGTAEPTFSAEQFHAAQAAKQATEQLEAERVAAAHKKQAEEVITQGHEYDSWPTRGGLI